MGLWLENGSIGLLAQDRGGVRFDVDLAERVGESGEPAYNRVPLGDQVEGVDQERETRPTHALLPGTRRWCLPGDDNAFSLRDVHERSVAFA